MRWATPKPQSGPIPLSASSSLCGGQGTRCGFSACRQGGLFDEISNGLRLPHIHGVAAFDLDDYNLLTASFTFSTFGPSPAPS